MSPARTKVPEYRFQDYAGIFAALGDSTRLSLLASLSDRQPRSISQLAAGSELSRQAITRHLRVLENVGLVHSERQGREARFAADLEPFNDVHEYLDFVAAQWESALLRLKGFVENNVGKE